MSDCCREATRKYMDKGMPMSGSIAQALKDHKDGKHGKV